MFIRFKTLRLDSVKFAKNITRASRSIQLLVVAGTMGAVGTLVLYVAHAGTTSLSVEPETSSLAGAVSSLNDSSASTGHAVKFGTTQATASYYQPDQNTSWMWEIGTNLDFNNANLMGTGVTAYNGSTAPGNDPVLYDIDGILNPASTVQTLHAMGKKAVCYIEVGTAGDYYSAADEGIATTYYAQLQAAGSLGSKLAGYPEYFININAPTTIPIMEAMINQQCKAKGFDAVETDLDETFNNNEGNTGVTITQANEETYLTALANYMHSIGLGWIAKNLDDTGEVSFVNNMQPSAQGMITEECNKMGTCSLLSSFLAAHKWIGNAEYTSPDKETLAQFCPYDNANNINGILFDASESLDGGRQPCR
jgi:hypothetical protein